MENGAGTHSMERLVINFEKKTLLASKKKIKWLIEEIKSQ